MPTNRIAAYFMPPRPAPTVYVLVLGEPPDGIVIAQSEDFDAIVDAMFAVEKAREYVDMPEAEVYELHEDGSYF